MVYLKKSKLILLFSILIILVSFIRIKLDKEIEIMNDNSINGVVLEKKIYANRISYVVKEKEKILVNCYECNVEAFAGDKIKAKGTYKLPNKNTVFHLFNYKNYLKSKKINYIFNVEEMEVIKTNNILYKLKNKIINRVNSINNNYLNTFILGVNELDDEMYSVYQNNGVSHLFAVSGMHISLLTLILIFILKKLIKNKILVYTLISIFLIFYMFLTNFSPSVLRSSLLFIGISFNNMFKLNFKTLDILLIILDALLIYNPYYFYSVSFLFSFTISIYLIIFNGLFNKYKNYFIKTFLVSLVSFLVSLPIVINNFFTINIMSPIINLISVPMISFIIFPLALLTFIFPALNNLLNISLNIFENISIFFSNISINLDFGYMNIVLIIIYYLIVTSILIKVKNYKVVLLILFMFIFYNSNYFNSNPKLTFIDVGQGDSALLELPFNQGNILIDTGGNYSYDLSSNVLIPYLKARNIKKIETLVISHGDYDHMGASIDLINSFKVEKVIFNNGEFNDLELELIKLLEKKNIPYYKDIRELNMNGNNLYFLNNRNYFNENDNSNVIYTELNGIKLLLMGDASVEVEEDILEKYDLDDIDILKVGHHGSKTSSSKYFIDSINPKYSIISVGKNNRYGHPNKEVVDNLYNSNIYRTDEYGSIMFKIKNNELEIEICPP